MFIGFWVKERTYFEQPEVLFSGDLIIAVMDEDGVSQVYSTIREINEMQNPWSAGVPTIAMSKYHSSNNKLNKLRLSVAMPGIKP